MFPLFAALLAVAQPAGDRPRPVLGHTAWLVATVGHSEWCWAGNVRLDLVTGRYQFAAGLGSQTACNRSTGERPTRVGRLAGRRLAEVRAAFLRVLQEGLKSQTCREGGQPEEIVISNGGTPVLVLTTGRFTVSAPDDLSCWTPAAHVLSDMLDRVFPSWPVRVRPPAAPRSGARPRTGAPRTR